MAAALPILEENDFDSSISIEGLKNIIECPVCLTPPTSTPVYRCDNGHILCNMCRDKVKICPECRIPLGNLRCLTSEKIVMAMLPKVACRFSNRGCEYRSKREILPSHELLCEKSKIKCSKVVHACEEYVEMLKLVDHVKSRHNCSTTIGNRVKGVELWDSDENNQDSCFWNYHHLQFDGNDFFTKIGYKDNMVYFWTYLVGVEEETRAYGYKVYLGSSSSLQSSSKSSDIDELKYKGKRVTSLFTSVHSLLDGSSGACVLAISRSTMMNLLRYNSNGRKVLDYSFEITKKDIESDEKPSSYSNQELFANSLDDIPLTSRSPTSSLLGAGALPPLLNRGFNPPGIITSMIAANEVTPPQTQSPLSSEIQNPLSGENQSPFLRQLLEDIRNTDFHEPPPQPQRHSSSSGWFGVVTKAVNKADNAVLNIVDRLPSISNSNRREASGSETSTQTCQSCQTARDSSNESSTHSFAEAVRHCVRKQCKCKCHLSPSSSLVQARRNHGAVQRSSNKKQPLERRQSGQPRETSLPIAGDERPRESLMMRILAAENASTNTNNLDNPSSTNRNSSNQTDGSSPPIPTRSSSKKKNKKK